MRSRAIPWRWRLVQGACFGFRGICGSGIGLVVDVAGRIFVLDHDEGVVLKVGITGNVIGPSMVAHSDVSGLNGEGIRVAVGPANNLLGVGVAAGEDRADLRGFLANQTTLRMSVDR